MIGQHVGKYRVLERIGRGGMGTVYRALDENLHREVAIKALNAELSDPEVSRRFRAEAITVARLNHPGIATIYELFEHEGQWLMVMEFVRGETLERLIERMGALSPQRASEICMQVLTALAHAHSLGVVHRDLKPANLMATESGAVKIMDFGIARVAGTEHLTGVGFMMGTPAYMAPEQVMGQEIDSRADLYAMGVVFYRLTTGKLPFKGETPFAMAHSQVHDPPTPIGMQRSDLPEWADQIVQRALAKAPLDRFQSAVEFYEAFSRCLAGLPLSSLYTTTGSSEMMHTPGRPLSTGAALPMPPFGATPTSGVSGPPSARTAAETGGPVTSGEATAPIAPLPQKRTLRWQFSRRTTAIFGAAAVVFLTVVLIVAFQFSGNSPPPPPDVQSLPVPPPIGIEPPVAGAVGDVPPLVASAETPPPEPPPPPVTAPPVAPPPPQSPPARTGSGAASAQTTPPVREPARAAPPPPPPPATVVPPPAAVVPPPPTEVKPPPPPVPASDPLVAFNDVKFLVITDGKADEEDAILNFVGGTISVTGRKEGQPLASMPYVNLQRATYVRSKHPVYDPSLASPPDDLELPPGFLGLPTRHWLVLQAQSAFVMLRLEDSNFQQVIQIIEQRTRIKVRRPEGQ